MRVLYFHSEHSSNGLNFNLLSTLKSLLNEEQA
jgi:hypothetical protein